MSWAGNFPTLRSSRSPHPYGYWRRKRRPRLCTMLCCRRKRCGNRGWVQEGPQREPEDSPSFCGWQWLEPGVLGGGSVFPLWRQTQFRPCRYQCPGMLCSEPGVGWKVGGLGIEAPGQGCWGLPRYPSQSPPDLSTSPPPDISAQNGNPEPALGGTGH